MTKIFNLSEAKDQLSSLVDRAASGEEIVIAKHGKPLARLGPMPAAKKKQKPREPSNALGPDLYGGRFRRASPARIAQAFRLRSLT